MPRPVDPETKAALRTRVTAHILDHGLLSLSLRPLATAVGTSARMLLYHFGSRDGLLREVLQELRGREDRAIAAWLNAAAGPVSLAAFLRWYWPRVCDLAARPALKLMFELYALALREPEAWPGVLDGPVAYWRRLGGAQEAQATLFLAALRGALLDLAATGDLERIDKAMALLLDTFD